MEAAIRVTGLRKAYSGTPAVSPRPSRVKARRCRTSTSRPSRASATSTRVVFVPMSMQPHSMDTGAMLP